VAVVYILWLREVKRYSRSRAQIIGSLAQPALYLLVLGFGLGSVFQRAGQGSYAFLGDEATAYLLGFSVGTNPGLVPNQVAAKKNTWEARAYWQSIGLNALDTNIIDSDFFEGRTNMQGVFLAFVYCPTDAIITTLRLGDADRANGRGPTPGSNSDLAAVQPLSGFRLLQLDLAWKF